MMIAHQRLLHDSLRASAAHLPTKEAIVAGGDRLTYSELLGRSLRLARALQDRGVMRGDRVAIFMSNTAVTPVAVFGTLFAGGVIVVINPETKEEKLAYLIEDAQATALVTEGPLARIFAPVVADRRTLRTVLCAEPPQGADVESFEAVLEATPAEPMANCTIPFDLAALIYTSGSTGLPKGVMMTHLSMVFSVASISEYLRLGENDRILGLLPLAFDYGLYQLLMSIRLGSTLFLERSFAFPAHIIRRVEEEAITIFPGVPTVYATLLSIHGRSPLALTSVRRVTNTAAALLPAMHAGLREIFPNALIFAMYGLTECKRVCYLEPEMLDSKPYSVGKAIPGTETFVLSSDGKQVAPGENGILHVRGPHIMAGYWRQPELSAHMLKEGPLPGERILCTHDWFTSDSDGFLYFVGRNDDIIKTRGEKVSPLEVENALVAIAGIKEAAVVGVEDDILGQAICAFVSLDHGVGLTEQEIIVACRLRLESFMVPRDIVVLEQLPKTDSGKVRKKDLITLIRS